MALGMLIHQSAWGPGPFADHNPTAQLSTKMIFLCPIATTWEHDVLAVVRTGCQLVYSSVTELVANGKPCSCDLDRQEHLACSTWAVVENALQPRYCAGAMPAVVPSSLKLEMWHGAPTRPMFALMARNPDMAVAKVLHDMHMHGPEHAFVVNCTQASVM